MVLSPFRFVYNFFHWPVTAEGSPQAALLPYSNMAVIAFA